jgi:3,4-dihydroxy 2-butanone 4-phosphate synthase / GTP cyclohydrolase II
MSSGTSEARAREAVARLAAGGCIVVEASDRIDRGYLMLVAELATPQSMAFVVRHTSGFVRVALTREIADRLALPMMTVPATEPLSRLYTVTVDAARDIGTGISATDRAHTARTLASPDSKPDDLSRPGHILPICAVAGGVLERPGFAEAAIDLARAAGFQPVGVLGDIVTDDGQLADAQYIAQLCRDNALARVTIDDLVAVRRRSEAVLAIVDRRHVHLPFGPCIEVTLHGLYDAVEHRAYVRGAVDGRDGVTLYVHRECPSGDVFESSDCQCARMLREDVAALAENDNALLVYVGNERRGLAQPDGTTRRFRADLRRYSALTAPSPGARRTASSRSTPLPPHQSDSRSTYGVAADVVKVLGIASVHAPRASQTARQVLRGHGLLAP